jgi:hypothetical protein
MPLYLLLRDSNVEDRPNYANPATTSAAGLHYQRLQSYAQVLAKQRRQHAEAN